MQIKNILFSIMAVTALFYVNPVKVFSSETVNESSVYGRVLSDGSGVSYVTVYLKDTSVGTSTDYQGNFMLAGLPAGTHILKIQGIGYRSLESEIEISEGETLELYFNLEQDLHLLEQVEVTGSRIGILRYLPGSAKSLSAEELKATSPLSGNEMLRQITGVHVVEEEGAGLRVNIGVRGLDPDRSRNVLVLEDGIPVALGPYGEPEMYYTPSIDRMRGVEVLKGSGSILYGPQTIGGVINYITSDPPSESKGFASVSGGEGGYFTGRLSYGNTFGNTGFQIGYLRRQAESLGTAAFGLNEINSKLRFQASPRSNVMIKIGVYDEESNSTYVGLTQAMYNNREGDYLRLAPDDNLDIRRYSIGIRHDFMISDRLLLNTTAYGYTTTRNWKRQDFTGNPGAGNLTGVVWGDESLPGGAIFMRNGTGNRNRQFEVAGLEPRVRYRFQTGGTDNVLDGGVRILYERAFEQRVNGTNADAVSGVLHNDEIRTGYALSSWVQNRFITGERLSFTAGLRTEMLDYERHILRSKSIDVNFRNRTYTSSIIPGAGVNYNVNNDNGLFAGVHKGFAPPRIKDAISSDGVDQELKAENSWNYELGARTDFFDLVGLDVTAFFMDFSNQVIPVSESSGGAGSGYINGGRTSHRGIETELGLNISGMAGIPGNLSVNLNTTFVESVFSGDRFVVQKIASDTGEKVYVNIKGNKTPYAPGIIASGFIHYDNTSGFGFRLMGQYTGRQYTDVLNTGDTGDWLLVAMDDPGHEYIQATANGRLGELPQFFIMNVSAWYDIGNSLRLNLGIKNMLDERYIVSRRPQGIRAGLPRLFTAGLSYRF